MESGKWTISAEDLSSASGRAIRALFRAEGARTLLLMSAKHEQFPAASGVSGRERRAETRLSCTDAFCGQSVRFPVG